MRFRDARKIQSGLFLTESCCDGFWDHAAPAADSLGVSWMQWEWKAFCKETNETLGSTSQNASWGACKTGFAGGAYEYSDWDTVRCEYELRSR